MLELAAGALALGSVLCAGLATARLRRDRLLAELRPKAERPRPGRSFRSLGRVALVAGCVLACAVGSRIAGVPGGVATAAGAVLVPRAIGRRRQAKERALLDELLADAVASIGSALRTGLSLTQALARAGREIPPPLGPSLSRVADRTALGIPLDDALTGWLDEIRSTDARLVVGVLRLHRRTGGASPRVLDELARTLRERRSGAREVRSLTAQARLSAAILGLLPIGFFLFLSTTSRGDIEAAARTGVGLVSMGVGFTLQLLAYLWIRNLLRVEA
jgi:tight adherence protein B